MNFSMSHEQFLSAKKPDRYIAIFKGSEDPSTGINWCSDCIKAGPFIKEQILPKAKEADLAVYSVDCGLREVWADKVHPLRVDPKFRLTGVPTMIYVEDGHQMNALVESELMNPEMIEMFFEFD